MKKMRKQFIELLNIHGVSGKERPVRDYLKPVLSKVMDTVVIDSYGNLLADKKCGNGEGATIMLSAHMDTVKGVLKDRELIESDDGTIMSSKGALGADDRGGIAIILAVLRNLKSINFNGSIKVAFSREEEVGCIGAGEIDSKWYKDTDLAIVVDRRGNRDIVVGCGMPFCSDSVGVFMEDVSKMADMNWECVEGGISDAFIFAEEGINSINLSAGYYNEHTHTEYAVIEEMEDTVKLIVQTFAVINQFYKTFDDVGRDNQWVENWYTDSYNYRSYEYYRDTFGAEIWIEEKDVNGDIAAYDNCGEIVIEQGDNEVVISRDTMKSIISKLGEFGL